MVTPEKSAAVSLPSRARRTMSSYAVWNWVKDMSSQPLIAATTSERDPSLPGRSIARPRLVCAGVTAFGLPSTSAKCRFMLGNAFTACTIAYPSRWVNEILPPRVRARWLLMTRRLSIISFAGIARTEVAVGICSEADMFFATAAAAPRRTFEVSSAGAWSFWSDEPALAAGVADAALEAGFVGAAFAGSALAAGFSAFGAAGLSAFGSEGLSAFGSAGFSAAGLLGSAFGFSAFGAGAALPLPEDAAPLVDSRPVAGSPPPFCSGV